MKVDSRNGQSKSLPLGAQRDAALLVLPLPLLLLLLAHETLGQGLLLGSRDLGASGRVQSVMSVYAAAQSRAQQLHSHWARMTPKSCSQGKAALCGRDVTHEAGTLSIMTSPAAYDSRLPQHTGGFNLVNPPGAQLSCSACVAFAVTAAAETAMAARLRINASRIGRISPRFLFFCTEATRSATCSSGMELPDALSAAQDINVWPLESCLPWQETVPSTGLCGLKCPVYDSKWVAVLVPRGRCSYTRGPKDSIFTMAQAQRHIRDWGAIVTKFALDADHLNKFLKHNHDSVYKQQRGGSVQGHAVTLVGYNNTGAYWIVKNSFGPQWGAGGFFKVAYGHADIMDPAFTYGLTWQPDEPELAPAFALTKADAYVGKPAGLQQLPAGCFWYKARKGDYAQRIAQNFGIPVERLLNFNLPPAIPKENPGAWLEGRILSICLSDSKSSPVAHDSKQLGDTSPAKCPDNTTSAAERTVLLSCTSCVSWWIVGGPLPPTSSLRHCDLYGITCDAVTGLVKRLIIPDRVLIGALPSDFGHLASLTDLDLSSNKLEGSLPAAWACLANLQLLDLHSNQLNGTIPAFLRSLKQLATIDLSSNQLSGELTLALTSLPLLETLLLHNNRLEGTMPADFGRMKSLAYLSVTGNTGLRGCIPAALKGRVSLLDAGTEEYTKEATAGALRGTMLTGFCN